MNGLPVVRSTAMPAARPGSDFLIVFFELGDDVVGDGNPFSFSSAASAAKRAGVKMSAKNAMNRMVESLLNVCGF